MSINRNSAFDRLLKRNIPHILEKILLYLDYETLFACPKVCRAFRDVMAPESFRKKAKSVYAAEIRADKIKLSVASRKGYAKEVTRLLSNLRSVGVDINFETSRNGAPLHNAAKNGHEVVVKLLLGAGADPNQTTKIAPSLSTVEETPLHRAVELSYPNVVRLLLDAGADPNKRGKYGDNPLISAVTPLAIMAIRQKN